MTTMPHPPYSPDLAPSNFLFVCFPDEKSPQREHFANVEEVKQKTAGVVKGIKIDKFKNCLGHGKDVSIGVLHQVESTLKVTEV